MFNLLFKLLGKIEDGWNEIKYGVQRMFRGYDDRVLWSVGEYLCKMLPIWIRIIRKRKQGIPISLFPEVIGRDYTREEEAIAAAKFDLILKEMEDGFEAGSRIYDGDSYSSDFDIYKLQYKKDTILFNKATKLLAKHFMDLRD